MITLSAVPSVIGVTELSLLSAVPIATLRRWATRGMTPPAAKTLGRWTWSREEAVFQWAAQMAERRGGVVYVPGATVIAAQEKAEHVPDAQGSNPRR